MAERKKLPLRHKHTGTNHFNKAAKLPYNYRSLFSNISKLTNYGQVEILRRV